MDQGTGKRARGSSPSSCQVSEEKRGSGGPQRVRVRRPQGLEAGMDRGSGQVKASLGSLWAAVMKSCTSVALDFGISLFFSPHPRMFQLLCLHNNLEFLKVTEVPKPGHLSLSKEDDSVAWGPKAPIPYIRKRHEIFKDLLLLLQAPTWPFLGQQPICKCLVSLWGATGLQPQALPWAFSPGALERCCKVLVGAVPAYPIKTANKGFHL